MTQQPVQQQTRTQALALSDVSIAYGRRTVIDALNLPPLAPGTLTALIGPNAAGKSTLLRGIAGLCPVRGRVLLGAQDLAQLAPAERSRRMTYMPQTLPPAIGLSVVETVISALRASSPVASAMADSRAAYVDQAFDALERLGIGALAMRSLAELSGGQRQLASLAQAIARRPQVLLLDEPTSALDLRYQVRVLSSVHQLVREHGLVGVVVLHDIGLAARFADSVAVLHEGRVAAFGTPEEAITAGMLARAWQVSARVERCSRGLLQVIVDDTLDVH
ncbi:ABC transporter ATP-binding protein [Variovorax sp. RCC_210]|uniref:ABC transporter ATP-binding protein n=1 Tax=Variovorax sp. RCC_210 TaxID=3239217 RepID=UPI00352684C7